MSDFTIMCGTEKKEVLRCNKLILSLSSSVFKEMFTLANDEPKDGIKDTIEINEDPETMRRVLKFAYTDQVEENMIDTKLLLAADKYEVNDLRAICENYLTTNLTLVNVLEIADDTFQYGSRP